MNVNYDELRRCIYKFGEAIRYFIIYFLMRSGPSTSFISLYKTNPFPFQTKSREKLKIFYFSRFSDTIELSRFRKRGCIGTIISIICIRKTSILPIFKIRFNLGISK